MEENKVILPTFLECLNAKGKELFYVDSGLERFKKYVENNEPGSPAHRIDILINQTQVLPIISDPTSENGDGDNLNDIIDREPLRNIFPKATKEHLFMLDESTDILSKKLEDIKKNFYRDEKLVSGLEHAIDILGKVQDSIHNGSYDYTDNDDILMFIEKNYNYGQDEVVFAAAGLVSYLGELISIVEFLDKNEGKDYRDLVEIFISAINENDIKVLLENKELFKEFADQIDTLGDVSDWLGLINLIKSIWNFNYEENKRTLVAIQIPVYNSIYFFDNLYDKDLNHEVYGNKLDMYDKRVIKGFTFRISDRG